MEDLTGKVYNGMKVMGFSHIKHPDTYWKVQCVCGVLRKPMTKIALKRHSGRCTCKGTYKDLTGRIYNKLQVISLNSLDKGHARWNVRCVCGKEYSCLAGNVKKNKDGCGSHRRPYLLQDSGVVKVDISTDTYKDKYTYVDRETHEKFMLQGSWLCGNVGRENYYAVGSREGRLVRLHNLILPTDDETLVVDHIDGNTLNNLKSNLRLVTYSGNSKNTAMRKSNTTGQTGVRRLKNGSYKAYITADKVRYHLGYHKTLEAAVKVRKEAEIKHGFHANHGRVKKDVKTKRGEIIC